MQGAEIVSLRYLCELELIGYNKGGMPIKLEGTLPYSKKWMMKY